MQTVAVNAITSHTTVPRRTEGEGERIAPEPPSTHHTIRLTSDDGTIRVTLTGHDPADYPAGTQFNISITPA